MSITAITVVPRRRKRRELWHLKFIFSSKVRLENDQQHYRVRFETLLRRWSVSKNRWLYALPTERTLRELVGTDLMRG